MKPPLPEVLPEDPLPLVESWLAEAAAAVRNATAMTLATVTPDGRPAARMVICRGFDARAGWFVFYTDRDSDKGAQLRAVPRAALVFHWDVVDASTGGARGRRRQPSEPAARLPRRAARARGRGDRARA